MTNKRAAERRQEQATARATAKCGVPPLRYAAVGMTVGGGAAVGMTVGGGGWSG